MSRIIRVGSRESKLAVIQSELVIEAMRACDPSIQIELVTMKTTGDKILDRTLDKVGGKGLFVKELDRALLAGEGFAGAAASGFAAGGGIQPRDAV